MTLNSYNFFSVEPLFGSQTFVEKILFFPIKIEMKTNKQTNKHGKKKKKQTGKKIYNNNSHLNDKTNK